MTCRDCCATIAAFILPPVGVFFERGCDFQFLLNILLTILGYLPGLIHALFIVCVTGEEKYKQRLQSATAQAHAHPLPVAQPVAPHPGYPHGAHPVTIPSSGPQPYPGAVPQHPGQYPIVPAPGPYPSQPAGGYVPPKPM